jgi:hypothetical protein
MYALNGIFTSHWQSGGFVSVHPPTANSLVLRERVRVRACKISVLQKPSSFFLVRTWDLT